MQGVTNVIKNDCKTKILIYNSTKVLTLVSLVHNKTNFTPFITKYTHSVKNIYADTWLIRAVTDFWSSWDKFFITVSWFSFLLKRALCEHLCKPYHIIKGTGVIRATATGTTVIKNNRYDW